MLPNDSGAVQTYGGTSQRRGRLPIQNDSRTMTSVANSAGARRWAAVGQALRARRQQLARLYDEPTWRTRGKFAEARGFSHDRTISDMENGRRDNYEADTIAAIEDAYEWQPGSIAAVLKGSPPTAKPPAPVRHDLGELDAWVLTLRDLSPQDLAAIKELAEVYLRGVKER